MWDEGEVELRKIVKYCRKLKDIDIKTLGPPFTEFAPCLDSYGTQLEYASIHCVQHKILIQVVESCPNARFNIGYGGLVGKQLEKYHSAVVLIGMKNALV